MGMHWGANHRRCGREAHSRLGGPEWPGPAAPKSTADARKRLIAHEAEGGASGALTGVVLGAAAGPPGMVAGAIIGGMVGAVAGSVLHAASLSKASRARELDAQIGVSDGDLGAPNLEHPAAKTGVCSTASLGLETSSGEEPAEGPMQEPEE